MSWSRNTTSNLPPPTSYTSPPTLHLPILTSHLPPPICCFPLLTSHRISLDRSGKPPASSEAEGDTAWSLEKPDTSRGEGAFSNCLALLPAACCLCCCCLLLPVADCLLLHAACCCLLLLTTASCCCQSLWTIANCSQLAVNYLNVHSTTSSSCQLSPPPLQVTFLSPSGEERVLSILAPALKLQQWREGIDALARSIPVSTAGHARWGWVISCLETTGSAKRLLSRTENFSRLLSCANIVLEAGSLTEAIGWAQEARLPDWLMTRGSHFNSWQLGSALIRLSAQEVEVGKLFERYANEEGIGKAQWVEFVRAEQIKEQRVGGEWTADAQSAYVEQVSCATECSSHLISYHISPLRIAHCASHTVHHTPCITHRASHTVHHTPLTSVLPTTYVS